MKSVYISKIIVDLNINGEWITVNEIGGRYIYKYGEVPENRVEKYDNEETVFKNLIKATGCRDNFDGYKTF